MRSQTAHTQQHAARTTELSLTCVTRWCRKRSRSSAFVSASGALERRCGRSMDVRLRRTGESCPLLLLSTSASLRVSDVYPTDIAAGFRLFCRGTSGMGALAMLLRLPGGPSSMRRGARRSPQRPAARAGRSRWPEGRRTVDRSSRAGRRSRQWRENCKRRAPAQASLVSGWAPPECAAPFAAAWPAMSPKPRGRTMRRHRRRSVPRACAAS